MSKTINSISQNLKKEASSILKELDLEKMLNQYREIFYTGSYALDLMTWKDIDIQIILKEDIDPTETISFVLNKIMKHPCFVKSKIIHFHGDYKPMMPRGMYLGFDLDFKDSKGIWKFDLWILNHKDFNQNRELIEKIKQKLTPKMRELILDIKNELQHKKGRVPKLGSHFLYQAIVFEKMESKEAIYRYLSDHGVAI